MRSSVFAFAAAFGLTALAACSESSSETTNPPAAGGDAGGDTDGKDAGGGSQPDAAPPVSFMNTTVETIDVDGASRSYVLSVPKTYDAGRSYPLLVALHGDGQGAEGFVSFSKLEAATRDEAIIAYPEGSVDLFTPYDQNPDQKLIERIIVEVSSTYSIDSGKIWGFGYSKGAYQLNELACKKPGLLTAMAVHAGGAPQTRDGSGNVDCPNAVGLPVFVTHGEDDDVGGGLFGADYWASRAGCSSTRSPTTPPICEAYDGCDPGKPVVFCVVPGHPHYPIYPEAAAHSWAWFKTL